MAAGGLNLGNIKLTEKQQKNLVVVILLVGAVGYGYWKFLFSPMVKKYAEQSKVLEQKKADLRDARQMVMKYPEFLQRQHEINRKVDFMNRRLPHDPNISDTIRELTKKATESNIKIINFQPEKEKDKGNYREIKIKVNYNTNYKDLGNFLTSLGYIERLTTPSDLKVFENKSQEDTQNERENISVDMMVKIYAFKE